LGRHLRPGHYRIHQIILGKVVDAPGVTALSETITATQAAQVEKVLLASGNPSEREEGQRLA
jgi:hypothetical protein